MRREQVELGAGTVIAYGHFGRPFIVFPDEAGSASTFEEHGMIDALAHLIDAGRLKLYCVDSADAWTWSDLSAPIEERARRHAEYEGWIRTVVAGFVSDDCGGAMEFATLGCSLGAYHAVNIALKHAHVFSFAVGLSGNYDPTSRHAWGEPGDQTYYNNPLAYVANLHGGHLEWLRERLSVLLLAGQGADPDGSLPSTRELANRLQEKRIRHELDVWGRDVPQDWTAWQEQLRRHLPRFC